MDILISGNIKGFPVKCVVNSSFIRCDIYKFVQEKESILDEKIKELFYI